MLVKECYKSFSDSVNFIDKNDNFVGFDMNSQCCEQYGWFFAREIFNVDDIQSEDEMTEEQLKGYFFDTTFVDTSDSDCVVFKIINEHGSVAFLHLFNDHNGYYSHGWESSFNGKGYI
ncbi:hypothetical protein [Citrobacter phage Tr1]|nr:hypothetical protein [Citrobacter phage Tr1]